MRPPKPEFLKVWAAPALHNRATRRRAGMLSADWAWDLNASEETRRTYLPRFIRRHYSSAAPTTRRQRRNRARIARIVSRTGVGQ